MKIIAITIFVFSMFLPIFSWSLAPEIEVDRLLLQAKEALDTKDFALATESLKKAEKLPIKLPPTFYFHYGRANAGNEKYEDAITMYERYLTTSGTKGKFYKEALVGMNEAEASIKKRDNERAAEAKKREEDRLAATRERDAKLASIKESYERSLETYKQDMKDCPAEFRDLLAKAKDRLQRADNACISANCDYHEQINDRYANIMSTLERRKARSNLENYAWTNAGDWCDKRYSEPNIPSELR
jgi:hypothetical protein